MINFADEFSEGFREEVEQLCHEGTIVRVHGFHQWKHDGDYWLTVCAMSPLEEANPVHVEGEHRYLFQGFSNVQRSHLLRWCLCDIEILASWLERNRWILKDRQFRDRKNPYELASFPFTLIPKEVVLSADYNTEATLHPHKDREWWSGWLNRKEDS